MLAFDLETWDHRRAPTFYSSYYITCETKASYEIDLTTQDDDNKVWSLWKHALLCDHTNDRTREPVLHRTITKTFYQLTFMLLIGLQKRWWGVVTKASFLANSINGDSPSPWPTHTYLSATAEWAGCWKQPQDKERGIKTHIKLPSFLPVTEMHNSVLCATFFHSLARGLAHTHWSLLKMQPSLRKGV